MPTLADMQASLPKCDRLCGPLSERASCGKPMRWFAEPPGTLFTHEPVNGVWVCPKHGPVMDGREAAERAGYIEAVAA